jgi:hypothetical protein
VSFDFIERRKDKGSDLEKIKYTSGKSGSIKTRLKEIWMANIGATSLMVNTDVGMIR